MTAKNAEKLCNQNCVDETVRITGEKPEWIRDVMRHVWAYTRRVIDSGSCEEVYLYQFGKFKPRMHMLSNAIRAESRKETLRRGREELERQMTEQKRKLMQEELRAQKNQGGTHG